jgi:hypothetical protein
MGKGSKGSRGKNGHRDVRLLVAAHLHHGPYCVVHAESRLLNLEEPEDNVGRVHFVSSPESDGSICWYDLSDDQRAALDARIERNRKLGLGNGHLLNGPKTPERERAAEEAAERGQPFRTPNWMERAEGKEAGGIPLPRGLD